MRAKSTLKRQRGFSLIEVIVVLVLVGILAGVTGFGLVTGARGYLMASENAAITQKAQLAMTRLSREIIECFDCDQPDVVYPAPPAPISLPYQFLNVLGARFLRFDPEANKVLIGEDATNAKVLVDQVYDFTLERDNRGRVIIKLTIAHQHGGGNLTFETSVFPRNTFR